MLTKMSSAICRSWWRHQMEIFFMSLAVVKLEDPIAVIMEGGRRDYIFVTAYLAFVWVFLSPRTVPLPCHRRWPWPSLFSVAGCRSTHWGQMTHICVGKMTRISSDNGLAPEQRQTIFWTNTGILLIGPLGTNFSVPVWHAGKKVAQTHGSFWTGSGLLPLNFL